MCLVLVPIANYLAIQFSSYRIPIFRALLVFFHNILFTVLILAFSSNPQSSVAASYIVSLRSVASTPTEITGKINKGSEKDVKNGGAGAGKRC